VRLKPAFSLPSTVLLKALARLPSSEGMAAMPWINTAVINPVFLNMFMGTANFSLVVAVPALLS